nr:unnamed protein product [Ipomoea trifida]
METGGNGSSLFGNRGLSRGDESGGGNSPGAGGGDNRRLRLLQQPLHRLFVGLVTQFPSKLKDPGGAESRHANSPTSSIDLFVSILVRTPLRSNLKLLVIVVGLLSAWLIIGRPGQLTIEVHLVVKTMDGFRL